MRDHDELLRRYLLGRLETEERDLLEERLLREADLLEEAEAVEADLLDDYAHGRLAPEERQQLAHRLASSPRGRERLALVQDLGRIASEKNGRVLPFLRKVISRPETRAAVAAIAAMLVIAVNYPSWIPLPPVPLPPKPKEEIGIMWNPSVPPNWDTIRKEQSGGETPIPPSLRPAALLVIKLALGTLRGEGMIPERNVPPGTEHVQLHLLLSEADKNYYTSFQATVRGPGPELRAADLEAREIEGRWTLVLELDPKLPEGPYEVEVSGVTAAGAVEPITTKELDITRNASADAGTPD